MHDFKVGDMASIIDDFMHVNSVRFESGLSLISFDDFMLMKQSGVDKMHKFHVGDKVRRVNGWFNDMLPGDVDTVTEITSAGLILQKFDGTYDPCKFELVTKKRPHADAAIHYFNGGDVDWKFSENEDWEKWVATVPPAFYPTNQYRIHDPETPEQKQINELEAKITEYQALIAEIKQKP